MEGFRGLLVYQKSYALSIQIYKDMSRLPREEEKGIVSQLRRAAVSIPANIAEGYAKKESFAEYKRFLTIAKGSCYECMVWVDMCADLGFMSNEWRQNMLLAYDEIARILYRIANPSN